MNVDVFNAGNYKINRVSFVDGECLVTFIEYQDKCNAYLYVEKCPDIVPSLMVKPYRNGATFRHCGEGFRAYRKLVTFLDYLLFKQ